MSYVGEDEAESMRELEREGAVAERDSGGSCLGTLAEVAGRGKRHR